MKAVVKYAKGKGLVEIRDVPEPKVKDDEVLIEVKAVSVCGSDLHIYHDNHPYWPPIVLISRLGKVLFYFSKIRIENRKIENNVIFIYRRL
jgi:threonine dehydrogenase-like Zn-dependent dehydrogenase